MAQATLVLAPTVPAAKPGRRRRAVTLAMALDRRSLETATFALTERGRAALLEAGMLDRPEADPRQTELPLAG